MDYDFNPEERPRRRAASGLLLVLAVLVGWLSLADGPARAMSTTTVSAGIFTYDAQTVERVNVHAFGAADASPAQLSVAQEGSASPAVEGRGASTTSSHSLVATNTVDDLAGAACRSNSFVPGTEVLMADGTAKPIEDVQVGDFVRATDPETGESGSRRVIDTIVGRGEKELVDVWDVQLSRTGQSDLGWLSNDGTHVNVSPFGEVTH